MKIGNVILFSATRIILLALLLPLQACAAPLWYTAEPIQGNVVDAETGQPLEGVVITANWQLEGGLEGSIPMGQMMVMETVTDKNGRYYFPGWGPKRRPLNGKIRTNGPQLLFFKSGYAFAGQENQLTEESLRGELDNPLRSDWDGKTIRLERLKGADTQIQYKELLNFSKEVDHFATWHMDPCQWTKLPIAVSKMMQERKKLEVQGASSVMDRTLDRQLLEGESYFIEQCGRVAQTFIEGMKK